MNLVKEVMTGELEVGDKFRFPNTMGIECEVIDTDAGPNTIKYKIVRHPDACMKGVQDFSAKTTKVFKV